MQLKKTLIAIGHSAERCSIAGGSHQIAAALAVGPIGPGDVVDVVASIAKPTKGAPGILEIDEGDAIAMQFPAFETIDIPEGAFRGRPPTPDDTVKGLAVSYRFVVPLRMLNIGAAAIERSIIKAKSNLMAVTPLANQIEAPDTDSQNPLLHQRQIFRLLVIADEATKASFSELESLEVEFRMIVASCVNKLAEGKGSADQLPVSLAVEHARRSIEARKTALGAGNTQKSCSVRTCKVKRLSRPRRQARLCALRPTFGH